MVDQRNTSRLASGYGNGRSSTASTTLKMAVLAPMPSAKVTTAMSAKIGFFTSIRKPKRKSCNSEFITSPYLSTVPSLVTQRHQRIDFRCSSAGYVAGNQRHRRKQHRDRGERRRIGWFHAKEHARHQSGKKESADQTACNSNHCQHHSLTDHHPEHIPRLRTDCHTNTNLVCALRDGV